MAAQAEALKVASSHWPLRDPQGKMSPSETLDYVMDQAVGHAVNSLTSRVAPQIVGVDAPTKFYVLVRYLYGDVVSYDDARRIALACIGASGVKEPVQEVAVDPGLGRMGKTQVGGESTKVLTLFEPWDRVRRGRASEEEDAPIVDYIHRAVTILEEGGTTMEAAQTMAGAGGAACEVVKALYQILPDRVKRGQGSVANREKTHLQSILIGVCQEGLHLIAKQQLDEERAQKILDDYPVKRVDRTRYDPILDQFLEGKQRLVEVTVEDVETDELRTILRERIRSRRLGNRIKLSMERGSLYLEKPR